MTRVHCAEMGIFMCRYRGISNAAGVNVTVAVDVTDIVKYVTFAGIAIVGIIFGTRCYTQCVRAKNGD